MKNRGWVLQAPEAKDVLPMYFCRYEDSIYTNDPVPQDTTISSNAKVFETEEKAKAFLDCAIAAGDLKGYKVVPKPCYHRYEPYVGLTDAFKYCIYCDDKLRTP